MVQIVIVLAFPVISAGLFTAMYGIHRLSGSRTNFENLSFYLYPVVIAVPFAIVLFTAFGESTLDSANHLFHDHLAWFFAAGISLATGFLLYGADLALATAAARRPKSSRVADTIIEGRTKTLTAVSHRATLLFAITAAVVVAEEIIWRQFLMSDLRGRYGLAVWITVLVSGVAYGTNHYYFGLRNVAIKAVHGCVWALLLVGLGSVIWPILSHLVFDGIVGLQLLRPSERAVGANQ